MPVAASIMTTIAAFSPFMFMSGIMGKFVQNIPFAVIIALMMSWFESMFILPSHLSHFSRRKFDADDSHEHHAPENQKIFGPIYRTYTKMLKWSVNHRYIFSAITTVALISSILFAVKFMPFELFSSKGIEIFFVRLETPIETPIERMEEYTARAEKFVAKLDKNELQNFSTQVGIMADDPNDPFTRISSNLSQIAVYLTPEEDRDRTAEQISEKLKKEIAAAIPELTEVKVTRVRNGPPVGKPIALKIKGDDFDELQKISKEVQGYLNTLKGVTDVTDNYNEGKNELRVKVDLRRASEVGLTVADIASSVRNAFQGGQATKINVGDEEIFVVVRFSADERENWNSMSRILVPNARGNLIPLRTVATIERVPGIQAIFRDEMRRTITVTGDIDKTMRGEDGKPLTSLSVNKKIEKKFEDLSNRYPGNTLQFGGEYEDTAESMASLARAGATSDYHAHHSSRCDWCYHFFVLSRHAPELHGTSWPGSVEWCCGQ
jgi:multidrug efflux pump subunit AcrB